MAPYWCKICKRGSGKEVMKSRSKNRFTPYAEISAKGGGGGYSRNETHV